ncbi:hypothetical protein GBAR_LOCUS531 [Geodia barretti]|uniref:Death domain-containing protein n=1 Tax=Geodia barretti TaxID=519541 RepID=A0AA35QTQ3_GEOBA|nr:hypothetical protein GBAR_LOCUS531 [Geodia barretti]
MSTEVVEPAEASAREEEEEGERGGGIGVLDVVKAVAPLLIIIGLALGMLVLGYIFVPETLTTPNFQRSSSLSSAPTPSPPSAAEKKCKVISGAKPLITALKDLSRWKELGLALGVPSEELGAFEKDNEEAELKKRGMLRTWYSRESGACWDKLVEALVGLGESSLAQEIARANGLSSDSV